MKILRKYMYLMTHAIAFKICVKNAIAYIHVALKYNQPTTIRKFV